MSVTVLSFEGDAVSPFGTEFKVAGIVPKAKSMFLYSVGETIRTQLVNMSFTISVKVRPPFPFFLFRVAGVGV